MAEPTVKHSEVFVDSPAYPGTGIKVTVRRSATLTEDLSKITSTEIEGVSIAFTPRRRTGQEVTVNTFVPGLRSIRVLRDALTQVLDAAEPRDEEPA